MRVFGTIVFGTLFTLLFVLYFLLVSVVSYTTDTAAVVDTFRRANLQGFAVEVADRFVQRELQQLGNPALNELARQEVPSAMREAISERRIYDGVATAHAALGDLLAGGTDAVRIDLAETKTKLTAAVTAVCGQMAAFGGGAQEQCAQQNLRLTGSLSDQPSLTELLTLAGFDAERVNRSEVLADLRRLRDQTNLALLVGGGILLVLLALILLLNRQTVRRASVSVGATLVVAATSYLIVTDQIEVGLKEFAGNQATAVENAWRLPARLADPGAAFIQDLNYAFIEEAAGAADGIVSAGLLIGIALLVGPLLLRRARDRVAVVAQTGSPQS